WGLTWTRRDDRSTALARSVPVGEAALVWFAQPMRSDFEDWARRTFSKWNAITIGSAILGVFLLGLGLFLGSR
ncbi:MAG TPA: hypothetical protein VHI50_03315, partial [Micromonosporaceae bacterium]|nr:hypothetical protein [Micromonosporaceae bacterium]